MHRAIAYATFGWLTLSGLLHFGVDVVSQYARGKRAPSVETTLYYGLNTAYALGQLLVGLLGLLVVRHALELLSQWPALTLSLVAAAAWLAFAFVFIEYREPKIVAAIFAALVVAMAATA